MKQIKFITHLQPYIPNGYTTVITDEDEEGVYFNCSDGGNNLFKIYSNG